MAFRSELLALEIASLKAELGLPEGRLPPAMYESTRRRARKQRSSAPRDDKQKDATTEKEVFVPVTPMPDEQRSSTSQQEVEREHQMSSASLDRSEEQFASQRVEREEQTRETLLLEQRKSGSDQVLLQSTESEELLSVSEGENDDGGEGFDPNVSGELVSLFLQDAAEDGDEDGVLAQTPAQEEEAAERGVASPSALSKQQSKMLAEAGNGWVVSVGPETIEERYLVVEQPKLGWFESNLGEKKEVAMFTGKAPVLGDFCACAVSEMRKGRREMSACIRSALGEEVVHVDLDVVKQKHGKSVRSLPKLYSLALTPILADRSKSELVLHRVPPHMESKALGDLLRQERQANSKQYRFGILRQKYGQTTEEEILSNSSSFEFEQFVASLGEKVYLKNHKAFKGGLSVHHEFSYYTKLENIEIMWHVAPLLPSGEEDGNLGKKRFVGNDCVLIVFQDSACSSPFPAGCIVSKFVHVVIVVRPKGRSAFRVSVQRRSTVAPFGPPMMESFVAGPSFVEWIIAKCILGEKSAFDSTSFAPLLGQVKKRQLESFRKSFSPNSAK